LSFKWSLFPSAFGLSNCRFFFRRHPLTSFFFSQALTSDFRFGARVHFDPPPGRDQSLLARQIIFSFNFLGLCSSLYISFFLSINARRSVRCAERIRFFSGDPLDRARCPKDAEGLPWNLSYLLFSNFRSRGPPLIYPHAPLFDDGGHHHWRSRDRPPSRK